MLPDQDAKGAPRFESVTVVAIDDQFTDGPRVFTLRKPTRLCTPTDTNGEGMKDPTTKLMCYLAKPVKGVCAAEAPTNAGGACRREQDYDCGGSKRTHLCAIRAKFKRAVGLFTSNHFDTGQVDTTKEEEVCVPSAIS